MKQGLVFGMLALATFLLLPIALLQNPPAETIQIDVTESFLSAETATEEAVFSPTVSYDESKTVSVLFQGIPVKMSLQEYLVGVLLGELPTNFSEQTFAAQAVACRTYTLRVTSGRKHPNGEVCTDHKCCQAWREPLSVSEEIRKKAEQAVKQTDGMVLTWQDKLIDATYFSCSGGKTEAAEAVWGSAVPYLVSVDSPGEEFAPRYQSSISFTPDEMRDLLRDQPGCDLSGSPETWFGPATETSGGGIANIELGGTLVSGTQLRRLLGLNSTVFRVTASSEIITFTVWGFGHRVGMSQYGAEAMARAGKAYTEILLHYYSGTELRSWEES